MIAKAIESYHVDRRHYPVTMEVDALQNVLDPDYIGLSHWSEFAYFSNGSNYVVQYSSTWSCCPVIEVRDGKWAKWPNCLNWDTEHTALHPIEASPRQLSNSYKAPGCQ